MLKKFSEAQEKGYNYMLFIELGYLTSKNDLSSFQVKAVTIEGYFETIKQIYDYVENIDFEETEEKDGRYECEVSNIYDVSRKIYFIKNELTKIIIEIAMIEDFLNSFLQLLFISNVSIFSLISISITHTPTEPLTTEIVGFLSTI